jgi:hypothetical protein
MHAVITWKNGGRKVIEDAELGDERVSDELHRLASIRAEGVVLTFEDDFLPAESTGE